MSDVHTWELRQGDTLLGTLTWRDNGHDKAWLACDFVPTTAFEPFSALFTQEAELLKGDMEGSNEVSAEIGKLNLSLKINNSVDAENPVVLHILDNKAWFRPLKSAWVGGPVVAQAEKVSPTKPNQ